MNAAATSSSTYLEAELTSEEVDPRIDAMIARAKAKARELGRWDAAHAIIDLIADELPESEYNAAAWYCANDVSFAALHAFWGAVGGRSEYSAWVSQIVGSLGTWVTWDLGEGLKLGLSDFERWTPPTKPLTAAERRAARPGRLCGIAGHGPFVVHMDPRGPDYRLDPATMREVCSDCFDIQFEDDW